jgi:hypothetical protein
MSEHAERKTSVDDYVLAIASARTAEPAAGPTQPARTLPPDPADWGEQAGATVAARQRAAARRLADRVREARRVARFRLIGTDGER